MPTTDPIVSLAMAREHLYSAVLSDALDGLGLPHQSPRVRLQPMTGTTRLAGRCKTMLWSEMAHQDPLPYQLMLRGVDSCKPDDVMICAASGSVRAALWGELLSTAARNGGCVGAIVDGVVRDTAKMIEMQFPVFARQSGVYDCLHRIRVVDINVPVEIEGVRFCPGDFVMADTDGIVVVPQSIEQEALQRAWAKVHGENQVRDAIRAGMNATTAFEKYGIL